MLAYNCVYFGDNIRSDFHYIRTVWYRINSHDFISKKIREVLKLLSSYSDAMSYALFLDQLIESKCFTLALELD